MRLRRPHEFRRVWSKGRSWGHSLFILWVLPNDMQRVRVGVTASKRVGNAVERNRARRLLREAVRCLYGHVMTGWDVVLVARSALLKVKEPQVESALRQMLQRAELWSACTQADRSACMQAGRSACTQADGSACTQADGAAVVEVDS